MSRPAGIGRRASLRHLSVTDMELLSGVVLLAVGTCVLTFALGLMRSAERARWTQSDALATAMALIMTLFISFGIGALIAAALAPAKQIHDLGLPGLLAAAIGAAATPVAVRASRVLGRHVGRARAARTAGPVPTGGVPHGPAPG